MLSLDCQVQFTQATSLLQLTLNRLLTGEIEIGEVQLIDSHREAFYELNNTMWTSDKKISLDKELVLQTLKLRCTEIEKVKEIHGNLGELINLCQHFNGITFHSWRKF